jgi:hypothetical protein
MDTVDSAAMSEILRATAIFLFKLVEVKLGPWEGTGAVQARSVEMHLTIERVYKGEVQPRPGEIFEHRVQRRGLPSGIAMDDYGLWSHPSLKPGSRILAFCTGADHDARQLLTDAQCERLYDPPEPAARDVEAAMALEAAKASPDRILATAAAQADQRTDIFARYAWARVATWATATAEHYHKLLAVLTDPHTHAAARQAYLTALVECQADDAGPRTAELVRAMFVLLGQPATQRLRPSLVEVYLPNLIGLHDSAPRLSADRVFHGQPAERTAARQAAAASSDGAALAAWLDQHAP